MYVAMPLRDATDDSGWASMTTVGDVVCNPGLRGGEGHLTVRLRRAGRAGRGDSGGRGARCGAGASGTVP